MINIASVAAYSPMASSPLASDGTGTYSCAWRRIQILFCSPQTTRPRPRPCT